MASDELTKLFHKATDRKHEILKDLREELAKNNENLAFNPDLYLLCRDYVDMENFQDVVEDLLEDEDDDDFNYGGCPLAKDFFEKDCECSEPKVKTGTMSISVTEVDDGTDDVKVTVKGKKNDGEIRDLDLNEDEQKKVVDMVENGNFEDLVKYLDEMLDEKIDGLQTDMLDIGKDLKGIKKELIDKPERTEKEEKRLNAIDELFERVRQAFSED